MAHKCKTCGKNSDGEYCFQHKPRTQLQKCGIKPSLTTKKVVSDGYIIQREMFLDIWKKRKHYSEVSGVYLGKEPMSTYFHHILAKEKYPEACLDEENIILLTLEEHSNVENDMYRYEEINNKRIFLKKKYNIL
tara:strand:+ start:1040 stop:1441 length:402 start_codon:yes stop_codon:yes gene_type:complete